MAWYGHASSHRPLLQVMENVWHYTQEYVDTNLCIQDREITTTKSMDTPIVQLGETMSFIGVIGEEFLTGAKITQGQPHEQVPTTAWMTGEETWKPGAYSITFRSLHGLKNGVSR